MIGNRGKQERRCYQPGTIARLILLLGAWLLYFFATQGAWAASDFEREWAGLIAAAKKEGSVAIASGGAPSRQYRPVLEAFQKKFEVKAEISTGGANDTINRVLAERKAGRFSFDVALISSRINQQRLVPTGSLIPLEPLLIHPEVIDKSKWYGGRFWWADKDSKYTLIYHATKEDQYEVWYNTDKIKQAEIASIKSQWDFFKPQWKGKIEGQAMDDPSGIRQMIDSWFEPDRGPKWVRTYLTDGTVTFSGDRRILETWLVGGRYPLRAVSTAEEELRGLEKKGLPVKHIFLPKEQGLLRAGGSGCCISAFSNAPHPNAQKLFINWFLSKEAQTITHTTIPNIDRESLRNDIPLGHVVADQQRKPGVKYAFPDAEPEMGAKQKEVQSEVMKIWESRQK